MSGCSALDNHTRSSPTNWVRTPIRCPRLPTIFCDTWSGRRVPGSHLSWWRPDCMAGHVRLELRNVVAKSSFERSHRFPVIQPNSGCRDYSRLSCDGGRVARAYCQDRGGMLALAGIAAFSADAEMIRRRPAIPLLTLRWTFPARRASVGSICSAERAAM